MRYSCEHSPEYSIMDYGPLLAVVVEVVILTFSSYQNEADFIINLTCYLVHPVFGWVSH